MIPFAPFGVLCVLSLFSSRQTAFALHENEHHGGLKSAAAKNRDRGTAPQRPQNQQEPRGRFFVSDHHHGRRHDSKRRRGASAGIENTETLSNIKNVTSSSIASERIVNGDEIDSPNSYPFFSHLLREDPDTGAVSWDFVCGGALIGDEWIITAAHCIIDDDTGELKENLYGWEVGYYCSRSDNCGITSFIVKAAYYYWPLNYRTTTFYTHDVALSRLEEALPQIFYAAPDWGEIYDNILPYTTKLRSLGNGLTETEDFAEVVQQVDTTVLPTPDCARRWANPLLFGNTIFCMSVEGPKLTCNGDSGGPVVSTEHVTAVSRRAIVVGIVSGGDGSVDRCVNQKLPDVFGRVSRFYNVFYSTICERDPIAEGASTPDWCVNDSTMVDCKETGKSTFVLSVIDAKWEWATCKWLRSRLGRRFAYCGNPTSTADAVCPLTCGTC